MAKNVLIVSLLIVVLVSLFLNYQRTKKVNESKDLLIKSLLSKLGEQNKDANSLATTWSENLKG